ncbi:hypothetical protein ACTMNS_10100 [Staphylococcus haemolyticus]
MLLLLPNLGILVITLPVAVPRSSQMKRRTKNAKAFHDKCENAYLGCWVWG